MAIDAQVTPWRRYLAEFIGTFVLIFAGVGAANFGVLGGEGLSPLAVGAVFGIALATMIYVIGHLSGAHLNPAVTIAFAVSRDFPLRMIPGYILGQLAGAALASLVLLGLFGDIGPGATTPQVSVLTALSAEFVVTFILMFVIQSVATDTRAIGAMAGLAAGAALLLGVFLAGPLTGGSLNPARSFGPALVSGTWTQHWLYWIAPIAGAIAGGMTYVLLRAQRERLAARQAAAAEELPPPPGAELKAPGEQPPHIH